MQIGRIVAELFLFLRHAVLDRLPGILDIRLVLLLTHLSFEAYFVLLVPGAVVSRSILFFELLLKRVKDTVEARVRLNLKVGRAWHMAVSPVDMCSCHYGDQ